MMRVFGQPPLVAVANDPERRAPLLIEISPSRPVASKRRGSQVTLYLDPRPIHAQHWPTGRIVRYQIADTSASSILD